VAVADQVQGVLVMLHVPGRALRVAAGTRSPGASSRRVAARHDGGRNRGALEGARPGHCWGPVVAGTLGSGIPWLSC
jgi:hypothetical protein